MALAQLNNATVAFAAQKVLEGVSCSIHDRDRVGLIGANGTGKTTLLRLLSGSLEPDSGDVFLQRGLRIGILEQEPQLDEAATVHDAALAAFADLLEIEKRMRQTEAAMAHSDGAEREALLKELGSLQTRFEHAGGYEHESRTGAVLSGVGMSEDLFDRPVKALSGGERSRLALARLLLRDADLLLLDEPTNHLDLAGIEWLEDFLNKRYKGTVILVSHDRTFLDRTVTRIIEVERARLEEYPGNYTKYVTVKAHRQLEQQRAYEKQQEYIAKEEDFYRRFHAAQRSKEARGRMKRLERLERIEAPVKSKEVHLRFDSKRDSSEVCLRIENMAKGYGERTLFADLGVEVYRGERIGVIGPNGSGKTTFLKALLGQAPPDRGEAQFGRHVVTGYLPQQPDDLHPESSVLDAVWNHKRTMDEVEVRSLLGRFLFSGDDDVRKRLADLSGGERKRVSLACIMADAPNLLILDEPTNHLDIQSRNALEAALESYDGTIIAVSHDRYFLNRICQRLIVIEGARSRVLYGTWDDYERRCREERAESEAARPELLPAEKEAPQARAKPKISKNRLAVIEKEIAKLEAEKAGLEAALADPDLYADAERARATPQRYKAVGEQLDALYAEWALQDE